MAQVTRTISDGKGSDMVPDLFIGLHGFLYLPKSEVETKQWGNSTPTVWRILKMLTLLCDQHAHHISEVSAPSCRLYCSNTLLAPSLDHWHWILDPTFATNSELFPDSKQRTTQYEPHYPCRQVAVCTLSALHCSSSLWHHGQMDPCGRFYSRRSLPKILSLPSCKVEGTHVLIFKTRNILVTYSSRSWTWICCSFKGAWNMFRFTVGIHSSSTKIEPM